MNAQVFISYAHADNSKFDEETPGWVSGFVDKLQKAMAMKPGGGQIKCWMDYRLEPQRAVDDELRRRIGESRCIVAFMSPRYLESDWCRKEMAAFVELMGGGAHDRVFLVEIQPTDRAQWHSGIQSIGRFEFWCSDLEQPEALTLGWPVPDPKKDRDYWKQLNRLAHILARQIQTPSPAPTVVVPVPAAMPPPPRAGAPLSVVINADKLDRELGKRVQHLLGELEVDATLAAEPLPTQLPADYRKHLETQLGDSHGVLIVYGAAPPSWVQAQHAHARKVLAFNRKGVWGALLDGPPEDKPDHGIRNRSLMLLNCRQGVAADALQEFVAKLGQGGAHV